jgi:hypothetical protein
MIQYSIIPLFGATGGAGGGSTSAAGRTGGALKFSTARKGKGRHRPVNFLALTFGAGNLLRSIQY